MMMAMVVAMVVVMIVAVRMRRCIGAALRLERRLDTDKLGAERLEQVLDARLGAHPNAIGKQLRRHMAVAEMPGKPRERGQVRRARLEQRLGRRHHFDEAAVVEQKHVVGAQPRRMREIDLEAARP